VSPDGGETAFLYDSQGQLRASQNAKQRQASTWSYTKYDAQSRITEVGKVNIPSPTLTELNDTFFPRAAQNPTERTVTRYDFPTRAGQTFLRSRVSQVLVYDTPQDPQLLGAQTSYSYDEHGNVKQLWQKLPGLKTRTDELTDQPDSKTVEYEYDLISGKVNQVIYQRDSTDEFRHRYRYDADNRLQQVFTSREGWLWNEDATYRYYAHGPLARTELGEYKVQGQDYLYTLQGWIKGVNALNAGTDQGQDADAANNARQFISQDAFSYSLDYFNGDYQSIGATPLASAYAIPTDYSLYNGNIASMRTELSTLGENRRLYRYDQLNRIISNRHTTGGIALSTAAAQQHATTYSYDANGNILTLERKDQAGSLLDAANYHYAPHTNRLTYITDPHGQVVAGYDIQNQSAGNYAYDLLGNLTKDIAGGLIDISWNLTGKVRQVKKDDGTDILHRYGPMGNRSYKRIDLANYTPGETSAKETWYVRDAQGNIMATYTQEAKMEDTLDDQGNPIIASVPQGITLEAQPIYGSSRIGQYMAKTEKHHRSLGHTHYELSNHLGNVLSTISDNKYFSASSGGKATAYSAHVLSQQDYLPFGLTMQGREYQNPNAAQYRFGFQAQEMDRETGFVNYKYRMHDPATGRFFAIDPLAAKYPHNSPYAFSENQVIAFVELEGLEKATPKQVQNALDEVDKFANDASRNNTKWSNLSKADFANDLKTILADPDYIRQGNHPTCGIACAIRTAANQEPMVIARMAISLYETGEYIREDISFMDGLEDGNGGRVIHADEDLYSVANNPSSLNRLNSAEFVLQTSIRSTFNLSGYDNQPNKIILGKIQWGQIQGITYPGDVTNFLVNGVGLENVTESTFGASPAVINNAVNNGYTVLALTSWEEFNGGSFNIQSMHYIQLEAVYHDQGRGRFTVHFLNPHDRSLFQNVDLSEEQYDDSIMQIFIFKQAD